MVCQGIGIKVKDKRMSKVFWEMICQLIKKELKDDGCNEEFEFIIFEKRR